MAKLYQFVIQDEKVKSFEDFITQNQDGLSKTVHKGFLAVVKPRSFIQRYEMHFVVTHPLKLRMAKKLVAYCKYPENTADNIFYYVPDKVEPNHLPMGSFKQNL